MTEMRRERRDEILEDCDRVDRIGAIGARVPTDELRTILHDSARLERIERQVGELADEWECEADNPSTTIVGDPDDIYRNLATALRAIVDTGGNK